MRKQVTYVEQSFASLYLKIRYPQNEKVYTDSSNIVHENLRILNYQFLTLDLFQYYL